MMTITLSHTEDLSREAFLTLSNLTLNRRVLAEVNLCRPHWDKVLALLPDAAEIRLAGSHEVSQKLKRAGLLVTPAKVGISPGGVSQFNYARP